MYWKYSSTLSSQFTEGCTHRYFRNYQSCGFCWNTICVCRFYMLACFFSQVFNACALSGWLILLHGSTVNYRTRHMLLIVVVNLNLYRVSVIDNYLPFLPTKTFDIKFWYITFCFGYDTKRLIYKEAILEKWLSSISTKCWLWINFR